MLELYKANFCLLAFEQMVQVCWQSAQHLHFSLIIVTNRSCMSSLPHPGYHLVSNYMNYLSIVIGL
jgi:hypothetical protein